MKPLISLIIVFVFVTCSKENNYSGRVTALNYDEAVNGFDTIAIPLNDLGKGTYKDSVGGLYPQGKNKLPEPYASDLLSICKKLSPIDSFGLPTDAARGRIVFISLGGSTSGHLMVQLKDQTVGNPLTNPKLALLNCSNGYGEASLNSIINPNDIYWDHVTQVVEGSGSSYRQVQIIYLETDDSSRYRPFPGRPNLVKGELQSALRLFKQKFPNIKLVYVLGRTRTFGNQSLFNREPSPYYFGWSCKWTIQDQINGVPGTEYKGTNAVAPMMAWGFYEWADSLPRKTDGFFWRSTDTKDGLHATPEAEDTLATRFQNFLLTDKYASKWYAAP